MNQQLMTWDKLLTRDMIELRVSSTTSAPDLAIASLRYFEEGKKVVLSCIGARSIAEGVKAVAIANGEAAQQGKLMLALPAFELKQVEDQATGKMVELTAIRLVLCLLPITV